MRLAQIPVELALANGDLRVVHLYQLEAAAILDSTNRSQAQVVDQLVRDVFTPYADFWQAYLGEEAAFRRWAQALVSADHPIYSTLAVLVALNVDSLFEATATWATKATGLRPRGTWYLVYGPGWTNMGGFSTGGMVADFTRQALDRAALASDLAHELTHQVHAARPADPDAGSVLGRIVSEGLAAYGNFVYHAGTRAPAKSIGYSDEQWAWAVANESALAEAAHKILTSTERTDLDRVASRRESLVPGGPTAAGYFLGFRIAAAYVSKHGPAAWRNLLAMPVAEALRESGYPL
jgi:hypothetical protein